MKPKILLLFAWGLVLACEMACLALLAQERRHLQHAIALASDQNAARKMAAAASRARELEQAIRAASAPSVPKPAAGASTSSLGQRFQAAMKNPDFLRILASAQKRMIAEHYRSLLAALHLDPGARQRFIDLLAEKQLEKTDAENALTEQGMMGRGLVIPAITEAQKDTNGQIAQLLGPGGYQAYTNFEMTDGLRTTLGRLQESLRYSSEPISDATVESLVTIMDQATPPSERGGIAKFTGLSAEVATGLTTQQFSAPLPADAVKLAAPLLTPGQQEQLAELMQQQEDELDLRSRILAEYDSTPPPS